MIDTSPNALWEEISAGREYAKNRLSSRARIIEQYHAGWGREDHDVIANHPYEFVSLVLPQIVYRNPRVSLNSRRTTDVHRMVASALQQGLNKWIDECRLADLLKQVCFDFLTGWGVTMLTFEENPRLVMPKGLRATKGSRFPMWPVVSRVSPTDFFFDNRATSPETTRWQCARKLWDINDLIDAAEANEDGTWILENIRGLQPDADQMESGGSERDGPDRNQVWVYEMWVPEDVEDNGPDDHGALYTLVYQATEGSDERKAMFVRERRNYYGPPQGPFTVFGAFYVSEESAYLGPLAATASQQREVENFQRSFRDSSQSYKRLLIAEDEKLARIIKDKPHLSVHTAVSSLFTTGGRPKFAEVQFGGASREQYDGLVQARDQLERTTGLSDAMRGMTGGRTTATEEQIAYQGGSIRVDDLRTRFTTRLTELLQGVAWYMFTDEDFVIPIGGEQFGANDVWFEGGSRSGVVDLVGMSFWDLEAVIEPYSMERITDSARMSRLGTAVQQALQMAQMMPQMPWLNWEEIVQDIGDAYNIPDFPSRFNWPVLQQVWSQGGMQAQPGAPIQETKLQSHSEPGSQAAEIKVRDDLAGVASDGRRAGRRAQQEAPQQ